MKNLEIILFTLLLFPLVLFSQNRNSSMQHNCCGSDRVENAVERNNRQNCLEQMADRRGERIMAGDKPQRYRKFTYPSSNNSSKPIKIRDEFRTNAKYEVSRSKRYRIDTKLLPESARILFFSGEEGEIIKIYEILPSNQLKLSYPQSEKEKVKIINNNYITAIGYDVFMIEDL